MMEKVDSFIVWFYSFLLWNEYITTYLISNRVLCKCVLYISKDKENKTSNYTFYNILK